MFFYAYVGLHGKDSFRAPHVLRRRCTFLRDIASIYVYVCVYFLHFVFPLPLQESLLAANFVIHPSLLVIEREHETRSLPVCCPAEAASAIKRK